MKRITCRLPGGTRHAVNTPDARWSGRTLPAPLAPRPGWTLKHKGEESQRKIMATPIEHALKSRGLYTALN